MAHNTTINNIFDELTIMASLYLHRSHSPIKQVDLTPHNW